MAVVETALIPSLIQAMELANAGIAAKGALNLMEDSEGSKVLGDPLTDKLADVEKAPKKNKHKYNQDEINNIMIELVSRGLSSKDATKVVDYAKEMGIELDDKAIYRAVYNKINGLPLLQGIVPPPNGDDDDNDDDDKEESKKDLSKEPNLQDLEDTKKSIKRRALENKSMKGSKAQKKLDLESKDTKTVTEVPRDKIENLSGDLRSISNNKRFDTGVDKAYRDAEEVKRLEREMSKRLMEEAPKFDN